MNALAELLMQLLAHLAGLPPIHQAARERLQPAEALVGCTQRIRAAVA